MSTQQAGHGAGIKRRTIVQGVAWSVPVVVAAQALPAFATSPNDVTAEIGPVCKYPGASTSPDCKQDYRAQITFTNTNQNPNDITTVVITSATFGNSGTMPLAGLYYTNGTPYGSDTFTLTSGQTLTLNVLFDGKNSANVLNGTFCVYYDYSTWQGRATRPAAPPSTTSRASTSRRRRPTAVAPAARRHAPADHADPPVPCWGGRISACGSRPRSLRGRLRPAPTGR